MLPELTQLVVHTDWPNGNTLEDGDVARVVHSCPALQQLEVDLSKQVCVCGGGGAGRVDEDVWACLWEFGTQQAFCRLRICMHLGGRQQLHLLVATMLSQHS